MLGQARTSLSASLPSRRIIFRNSSYLCSISAITTLAYQSYSTATALLPSSGSKGIIHSGTTSRTLLAVTASSQARYSSSTTIRSPTSRDLPLDVGDAGPGGPTAAETDAYLESRLNLKSLAGDKALERGRERAKEAGVPDIAVSAMQGQFLSVLAKSMGAIRVLEIGTLWGYSTTFLAKVLPSYGQLDTIELSPLHARLANETFLDCDLYPFPKVHVGHALSLLRDRQGAFANLPGTEEGLSERDRGYDLVFIDANKDQIDQYFAEALRLTRKGGLIIVDNAVRGGRISRAENVDSQIDVAGLRRLYDWVHDDAGKTVMMSGIQTVGAKFWDGFAIAVKL